MGSSSLRGGGGIAVVTGGGGGIGSAVALELAAQGATVIVVDSGVSVTGEALDEPTAARTVERIEAAGGRGRASTVSVTDIAALRNLFDDVTAQYGTPELVVNAAGILRFPPFPQASADDWASVLDVHLNGYLNVLDAALPLMTAHGYGRVVGVTSGVGLARTSPEGIAYGCAKRAVASATWELAELLPPGVTVNALSPIAATRMVREGLVAAGAGAGGDLDLSAMPQPEHMAPAAAYLCSEGVGWCRGQILYSAGSELSLIDRPRLMEAIRTADVGDLAAALGTLVPEVLTPADARQRTTGGSNPRFGAIFEQPAPATADSSAPADDGRRCLVAADDARVARSITAALSASGLVPISAESPTPAGGRDGSEADVFSTVATAVGAAGRSSSLDAIVVALAEPAATKQSGWQAIIDGHRHSARQILRFAAWLRAAADQQATTGRPLRLVLVGEALSPAGRTTARAIAQLARSANDTPGAEIDAYAVSMESDSNSDRDALGVLVARLAGADDTMALRGSELTVSRGWLGLRSHPAPRTTLSIGGPAIPPWADAVLRESVG